MNAIDGMACCKPGCDNFGKPGLNIVGHGIVKLRLTAVLMPSMVGPRRARAQYLGWRST